MVTQIGLDEVVFVTEEKFLSKTVSLESSVFLQIFGYSLKSIRISLRRIEQFEPTRMEPD